MDELILQVLSDTATPSQRDRVRQWRAESADNEAYFQSTSTIWSATEPDALDVTPEPVDPQVIVAAAEERRAGEADAAVVPIATRLGRRIRSRGGIGWSLAAAAAIAGLALGIGRSGAPDPPGPLAAYTAEVAARTVVLDDGSFVRLAPGSTVEVWDRAEERRVAMTGRAFFAVARDERRPFVVSARGVETRVLGTRFEVSEEGTGSVRTVVLDGRVAVANERGSVEVSGGSLAVASDGAAPRAEDVGDVYALLDWPSGLLLYQGTPLARVAREVGRFFGREVEVRGGSLEALRITGSFEEQTFEQTVLALCEATGAVCTLTDAGASIAQRP